MIFVCLQAFAARGGRETLGMKCASYRTRQTVRFPVAEDCTVRDGWQPGEMVHRRRWRNHNRSHQMTEGCGCERPAGLSLPTAESTEGKPQEWAADRDAVRTAETREITAETQFPADTLPKPPPSKLCAEREYAK